MGGDESRHIQLFTSEALLQKKSPISVLQNSCAVTDAKIFEKYLHFSLVLQAASLCNFAENDLLQR